MAGEIDNLNFKVILNDNDFKATIERDTRLAKQFNTTLSNILDVKTKGKGISLFSESTISDLSAIKKGVQEILDKMGGIKNKASEISKEMKSGGESMDMVKEKTAETKDLMGEVAKLTGIAFGGAQIKEFIGSLIRVSGEFETQKMALTSMLQSEEDANMIFSTLRKNALESPYTFQDLTKYAKQLVAFNISTDKLIETEKMLADVAAGLDVDMGRIILAYGQVKAAGALKGQELRQFTEAGVPLLQSLADQIERTEGKAISLAQVFNRISKKEIPFEMVEQAFKDMTSEGGKFYNMQEVLVETLKGKIGKLRDVWQQALYDIGNANSSELKKAVDMITNLVANMDKLGSVIKAIIVQYGAYVGILGAVAAAQKLIIGVQALTGMSEMIAKVKALTKATEQLAYASQIAKGASFALAAIATTGILVYDAIKKAHAAQERYDKTITTFNNSVAKEKQKLDELHKALVENKKGTEAWNAAKDEAVRSYGKYFNGLDQEITKVGNLSTAYDELTSKVEASIAARTFADYYTSEKAGYEKLEDELIEKVQKELASRYQNNPQQYQSELKRFINIVQSNRGNVLEAVQQELGVNWTTGANYGQSAFRKVDKAYNEFWQNTKRAAERMGLDTGGNLFNPEALLIALAGGGKKTPTTQPTWGNEGWQGGDKVANEQKTRIKTIMALQSAYKELKKDGYSEEEINQIIDAEFAWVDEKIRSRRDFWEELKEEANAMKDANAANSLRADISMGQSKEAGEQKKAEIDAQKKAAKEAEKALERYRDALKSWTQKDNGTVDKRISDYRTELNKIANEYDEMAEKARAAYPDVDKLNAELENLQNIRTEKEGAAKAKFSNNLGGLAKAIIDNGMYGQDMTNWGDKTVSQIRAIGQALDALEIPDDIKQAILKFPDGKELLANLTEEVQKLKDKLKQQTIDPEFWKSLGRSIKQVASAFNGVFDAAKDYAETVNPALAQSVELMEDGAKAISSMATAATKNDWMLVAAIGIAFVVEQIVKAATRAEKLKQQLAELREEINHTLDMAELSNAGESLFGTDNLAKLQVGLEKMGESLAFLNKELNALTEVSMGNFNPWNMLFGDKSKTPEVRSLEEAMRARGLAVYDENGILNKKSIEALKELGVITEAYATQLTNAIDKCYDSLDKVKEVMGELVGNIADDAADKIIDSWIEAGNAALDYADILDDVARSYAKKVVKGLIMDALPKDLASNLAQLAKDEDEAGFMQTLAAAFSSLEQITPYIEKTLEAFDPYFLKESSESGNGTLGGGIKGITEDTANLLATYLNAIRADVATGNIQRGEILSLFREYLNQEAAPSYAEYLTRIEAHTADILDTNNSILAELRDIITPESGQPAVRVLNA